MSDDNFLSRWSRRKHEVRRGAEVEEAPKPAPAPGLEPQSHALPVEAGETPVETPPLESLTPESDFAPFMNARVDPGLRNQALKKLFSDPRYNVMDGLDVYIADYSKPDPLPEGWLEKMNQVARLGDYRPRQEAEAKAKAEAEAEAKAKAKAEAPLPAPAEPAIAELEAAPETPAQEAASEPSDAAPEDRI